MPNDNEGRVLPESVDPNSFYDVRVFRPATYKGRPFSPASTFRIRGKVLSAILDSVQTATLVEDAESGGV